MITSLKKLWDLFNKKERLQIFGLLLAVLAMAFAQVIGVASVMPFMDLVMNPEMVESNNLLNTLYNYFAFESINSFTIFIGIAMFLVIVLSNAISTFAIWLKMKFVWKNNHHLSMRLLKQYLAKPYAYFLVNNSSDLGKNVLQEIQTLTTQYLIQLLNLIIYGLVAIAIIVMLFFSNFTITIAAILLLGGGYGAIYYFTRKKMKKAGEKRLEANKFRYKTANEAFNSIKQIKVRSKEDVFLNRFAVHSLNNADYRAWYSIISQLPRYILEAVAFGGIVLLVLFLIVSGEEASQVVPIVSLFAFAGYRLMPALQRIFKAASSLNFNTAILDRIHEDIFETGKFASSAWPDKTPEALDFKDKIELKNLSFSYPNDKESVLKNVNLEISKDQEIGLAGATGAGKSTLVNVILGLLRPEEGKMLVDGVELTDDNIRNWQQNIGYVPQDIYLCDDTILSNIAFGVPEDQIDLKAVKKATKIANIDHFIENELEKGYQTIVGERGVRVSGGQRQRLGLARALYHDPEVLVLDEATSSLDNKTQKSVMEAINNIAKVKTMIIIAHRLSTVKDCDLIYMLEQGEIIDFGAYEELANSNVKFRKLANLSG
ncbi:ABC transporter ATP-binding protein/permease [Halanaerobium sp. Z-7514]|uniref:ABC transporter ATP-binding protein/permease n=1 Tax=Halanaerobium polyolivorans TaxID=2886943 RepID=A0AAW4X1L9_9FIRM|nr:ABC transporter ATP-binding protein [Halanaerobium polyolivorans]MCC3145649.1 ABC transporter ATP-binding protein/permease [Halanaerobium polyolivorans]